MRRICKLPWLGILVGTLSFSPLLWASEQQTESAPDQKDSNQKEFNVKLDERPVQRPSGPYASFAPIIQKVGAGVVKVIISERITDMPGLQGPGGLDPFWRHFFGGQGEPGLPNNHSRGPLEHGLGSGVLVTPDGYILTNAHVVDNAQDVKVTLNDGREFTAKVVGKDEKSDIAVIKIEAHDLPTVPLADSQKVKVGDLVLAIGNPFGVGQTVTQGIVSATDRGGMGIEDYEDFIQTDASINPGNSGGPLVDADGRVIGINTAILSRSGGNQGIGFAIPSALARTVMTSLVRYGHVTRGYLGVTIQDLSPTLAKEFNTGTLTGALVGGVTPDSPADKAGFKDGDVIVQFNGKDVRSSRQLRLTVAETKPGSQVPVEVMRDGNKKQLEVTLGRLPGEHEVAEANSPGGHDSGTLKGVGVSDLDSQARQQFKIPAAVNGAIVTEVQPDSAAAEAGIKPGDVIESINRRNVSNAQEAVQLTENSKSKRTLLRIWSDGGSHFVVVDESQPG